MKKRGLLIFAIAFAFILANAQPQKRLVLIEEFTNTGCHPCASWSPLLDSAIHYRLGDCIAIKYHSGYPYSNDEFYNYDKEAQNARINFYGVTGVPSTFVDGIELTERTYAFLNQVITWCRNQPAAASLTVSKQLGDDHILRVRASLTPFSNIEQSNVRLFVAAIEEHFESATPYPNNERELNYTMRKLITGGQGYQLAPALTANQTYNYEGEWIVDFCDDEKQLGVVAFLQDMDTHSVLATAYIGPEAEGENRIALMNVIDTPNQICTPLFHGKAIFRNDGAGTITSATLNVKVNDADAKQYPWTGNLGYLDRDTMAFEECSNFLLDAEGNNQVQVWLSDINGNDIQSNVRSLHFTNSIQAYHGVQLKIYTDKKPEETTWVLYNSAGDVVQKGGPYTEARKFFTEVLNLNEDDCYQLEFLDAGGDGIKGASGNGYYQLFQVDASNKTTRIAQGDYTGASHVVFFRLNGTPAKRPTVLFEEFTNTSCDPCAAFSPALDKTIYTRMGQMVPITYHWNFPSDRDPFYLTNPAEVETRAAFYGISGVPSLFSRGYHAGAYGFEDMLDSYIDAFDNTTEKVRIQTEACLTSDGLLNVHANVLPLGITDGTHLRLFVVAVEERVEWTDPAPNGERSWNYVMRKMLPDADGQPLENNLTQVTPYSYHYTWPVAGYYDQQQLGIVSFVQDINTKEVLGTCYTPLPTGDRRAAKIIQVLDTPDRICTPQFSSRLVLRNIGSTTLTSAVLNVSINGQVQQTPWSGTLRPLAIDTIATPLFTDFQMSNGKNNEVDIWVSNLNGSEQQTSHHTLSFSNAFSAQNNVRLTIMTDNKPEEITWTVYDSAGEVVDQGGPYTESRKKQVHNLLLPSDDCYTLVFQDAGGNGITGSNGRGYYMLHEVTLDGKTRLLVQADYDTATHEVYFSLQNAITDGIDDQQVRRATDDTMHYDLQGRKMQHTRKGISIQNSKKIIK